MHCLYVEKHKEFNSQARSLLTDIREKLGIQLDDIRVIQRYYLEGISDEQFHQASHFILSEHTIATTCESLDIPAGATVFAVEYLPGQYDQRADSAAQCIQILTGDDQPAIATATVYFLIGQVSESQLAEIKKHVINAVDSREADMLPPETLTLTPEPPADVAILTGFISHDQTTLEALLSEHGLAMNIDDLLHTQAYFRDEEQREPTITELKMLDTYWSDHCRHTTFASIIDSASFAPGAERIEAAYQLYRYTRQQVYGEKISTRPETLMDIALIGMKELRASGGLDNLEVSEEINAASIEIDVDVTKDGVPTTEKWLLMFKNETHNHPTEIEPFGGAATCLGGCIRDPLSGRSYVYQAMRVTGAADPLTPFSETLAGKLPQRTICREAAHGYSSYGNQIGLATGQVAEIYHPNYVAKRMEIGAVVAAAPKKNVFRGSPAAGDAILLIGGRTGRDGVGGATGSSKEHTDTALENSAEVQKGNPPTERKIQRLFRHAELAQKIKVCNDFGAGGVSVAIGEIAPSLEINLDKILKKYDGLDGTELAISESQERMAVCIDPADIDYFIAESDKENLECVHVADVTDNGRLIINWRGKEIVNFTRAFLDTNGVLQHTKVHVDAPQLDLTTLTAPEADSLEKRLTGVLAELNTASQKGLNETFDSSIGAATVLSPYGGKYQLTPSDAMVAKLPLLEGDTDTASFMSWGFDPKIASQSPFHGAVYAITHSLCRLVSTGARLEEARLTLQEYFEKLGNDPARWGKPFAALLGAFTVQHALRIAAIGGKDSMSGSFNDIDVPPTLVSFAVAPGKASLALSPEFKQAGSAIYHIATPLHQDDLPDFAALQAIANAIYAANCAGTLLSAHSLDHSGIAAGIAKMAFGNHIGAQLPSSQDSGIHYFTANYFDFLFEAPADADISELKQLGAVQIGTTCADATVTIGDESVPLDTLLSAWTGTLESVYPSQTQPQNSMLETFSDAGEASHQHCSIALPSGAKPKVAIPVFPGTNCEYDTARAFREAGASAQTNIFRNLSPQHVHESIESLAALIRESQILMLPGGFSAGDEPDGSGKFIATVLNNPQIEDAIMDLLRNRDGLILGICNGFQAFIKTGLLPYGKIHRPTADSPPSPTLTFNDISRHIARYAITRISSTRSPWLANTQVGDLHNIAFSHGEGKFYATEEQIRELAANGQIATQYTDLEGNPSMDSRFNPNGSLYAIEGITSPCGKILGKMGHTERFGTNVAKNIPGEKYQPLFKAGVDYFL